MNKTHNYIILFIFSYVIVSAQGNYRLHYSTLGYQLQDWNQHTISIGFGDNFNSKRYVLESFVLPITCIGEDYFNDQKFNFAVPIVPLLYFSTIDWGADDFNATRAISSLFSSRHHLFL